MIHGQSVKSLVESIGVAQTCNRLSQLIIAKKIRPEDFSLRELAESFCGHDWVRRLNERNLARFEPYDRDGNARSIMEAGEGVDVSAFANITGQIAYSKIHQGWNDVKEQIDTLFQNVPTVFDGEKVPGIGQIKGEGEAVRPGQDYPETGFGEQYFETPATTKRGMILSINKETIFFDRTSQVVKRAGEIGKRARMGKILRCAAVIAGVSVTVGNETFSGANHKWNGTTYASYSTTANAIGINAKASNPLINYTSIEQIELLAAAMTDPDTGRPIQVDLDTLIVMPDKKVTARRIVSATEIRTTYPGFATSQADPGVVQMSGPSPTGTLNVISSPVLKQVIVASGVSASNAADWWFMTELSGGGWEYRENWPLTVIQAQPGGEAEFTRDIVLRWKVSERGVPWNADPRKSYKSYNS